MALFTDPEIVSLDDLLQYESSLLQVSTTHAIDVDTKITLAVNGIGDKLMLWLLNSGASDPQFLQRKKLGLSTVVVTPTLYRWICFDSLSRFFAEAYNVQLNTRFQGKWKEYQHEAQEAADMVFMSGLGIVYNPLPKPAMPEFLIGPGSTLSQSAFVQTTWVDANGNEGAPGPVNGQLLPQFSTLCVNPAPQGGQVPGAAAGWNIYASDTNANLQRQNSAPVQLGTSWQMPSQGPVPGLPPPCGQTPNFYIALTKRIQRG